MCMGHDLALSDIFVADSFITTFLCRRSGTPSCTRGAWAWTLRGTTTAGCGGRPRGRRGRCSRGISAELPALGILRGTTGCVCHPSLGSSCTNRADTVFLRSGFELPRTQLNCCLRARGLLASGALHFAARLLPDIRRRMTDHGELGYVRRALAAEK